MSIRQVAKAGGAWRRRCEAVEAVRVLRERQQAHGDNDIASAGAATVRRSGPHGASRSQRLFGSGLFAASSGFFRVLGFHGGWHAADGGFYSQGAVRLPLTCVCRCHCACAVPRAPTQTERSPWHHRQVSRRCAPGAKRYHHVPNRSDVRAGGVVLTVACPRSSPGPTAASLQPPTPPAHADLPQARPENTAFARQMTLDVQQLNP